MTDADIMPRGKPSAPDMDILTDNVTIHPPLVPEQPPPLPGALGPANSLETAPNAATETVDFTNDPFVASADVSSRKLSPAFVHVRPLPRQFLGQVTDGLPYSSVMPPSSSSARSPDTTLALAGVPMIIL